MPAKKAPMDSPKKTRIHFQVEIVLYSVTGYACGSLDLL